MSVAYVILVHKALDEIITIFVKIFWSEENKRMACN
jgi:hypothetical protein